VFIVEHAAVVVTLLIYRVSINSFPDYKRLLQKKTTWNTNIYIYILECISNQEVFLRHISTLQRVLLLYST
jgi:hypothetical protein